MNMDVSNDELKELLERFMKRLDKMDKERDVMKKKLDRLSKHVSDVNKAIDEVYDIMNEGEVHIEHEHLTEDELQHIKISVIWFKTIKLIFLMMMSSDH